MAEMTARLLIVDDDIAFLEGLKASLVGLGYQVDRSSHGADALMAIRLVRPDVVLLDIRMRGLSGVEVLKRIRAMRSEEHTSELQSQSNLVCRLLLEKKKNHRQLRHTLRYPIFHAHLLYDIPPLAYTLQEHQPARTSRRLTCPLISLC